MILFMTISLFCCAVSSAQQTDSKRKSIEDAFIEQMKMAAKMGRETRPDLHLGICGEHGGDPSSVEFCHKVGLDYVSCSPFRVPIARLAATQAAIKEQQN